mgnify:CR=1 FL=1
MHKSSHLPSKKASQPMQKTRQNSKKCQELFCKIRTLYDKMQILLGGTSLRPLVHKKSATNIIHICNGFLKIQL